MVVQRSSYEERGVSMAFQNFLSKVGDWRPSINKMTFKMLESNDAKKLELPFFKGEVLVAFFGLCWDELQCRWFHYDILTNELGLCKIWSDEFLKVLFDNDPFERNLNVTFLVLVPKKSGGDDLKVIKTISLIGGLYMLQAQVLTNKLKR